jgi:hypothetical protein
MQAEFGPQFWCGAEAETIASFAASQFRVSEMIRKRIACSPAALAILFSTLFGHLCFSAPGPEHELIPIRDGLDLSRGNKRVLVTIPKGWEQRRDVGYAIGFGLGGRSGDPVISVWVNHRGRSNTEKVKPRNSYMGVNLETDIQELKLIDSFDAGVNGKLDVWRFRTYNRNYLLVLIVQPDSEGRTEVDAYLSAKDVAQLMPYLSSLKEVARSIRIVDR